VGMGVLPLTFDEGTSWQTLGLTGNETVSIAGLENLSPRSRLTVIVTRADGSAVSVDVNCRIDTADELDYFENGGILPFMLRRLAAA
jgi:aconitate hydratase